MASLRQDGTDLEEAAATADDNKALVRCFYAEIDAGNIDAMDELVAGDYVDHDPPFPDLPPGREGLKAAFRIFSEATPGRHEGDLPGPVPATGAERRRTAVAGFHDRRRAWRWARDLRGSTTDDEPDHPAWVLEAAMRPGFRYAPSGYVQATLGPARRPGERRPSPASGRWRRCTPWC